ncbi:hypothetical protein U1Q18_022225 [Sarracenia purpurea var. burkii]
MWTKKSKHVLNLPLQATMNPFSLSHSWEEQAFAEDAAGALGGFVWPPRSYSCSFCRREFRSAQALGGHMNVHRKDRARLKQSLTPKNQDLPSPNSPSRVSAMSTPENFSERTHVSPFSSSSSSVVQEQGKNGRKERLVFLGDDGCVETNLSMGLKLVVSRNNQTSGFDDDESNITRKRHKIVVSDERSPFYSQILGLKTGSLMEELDLELRLGDPPKVCSDDDIDRS